MSLLSADSFEVKVGETLRFFNSGYYVPTLHHSIQLIDVSEEQYITDDKGGYLVIFLFNEVGNFEIPLLPFGGDQIIKKVKVV